MYVTELFEARNPVSTLVIYPGRFQPWHKGHKAVFDHLIKTFGRDNVFIATSNKVDPPRSPFSFGEKVQLMHLTGVPNDRIVETKDPYKALEIVQHYDPQTTRLIFAVSEKDMAEDPRFKFGYKKDGSPTYLQAMPKNPAEMQPFSTHGYVMTVPTFEFTVLGEPMRSATDVRALFAKSDDKTQQAIIKDLFGQYSPEVHSLMKNKITLSESRLNESQVLDLTKNFPNHAQVHAQVIDVLPSGKVKLQVIKAESVTGKKPTVAVGQKLSMALNYLRRAPLVKGVTEDAAGVGVIAQNKKMAKDPRYSMSITKDVQPGQDKKNLRAWRLIK